MQKTNFFKRLVDASAQEGFSFLVAGHEIAEPQRATGIAFAANVAFGVALGVFSPLSAGYFEKFDKNTLINDLEGMRDCCDVAGIRHYAGAVFLRLIVDGDKLSGESIVGRCAMIHERAGTFRKYAMSIVKTWFSDVRNITSAEVYIMFSEHKSATTFVGKFAEKCAHYTYKKQLYTSVLVVDLADNKIQVFKTRMTPKPKVPVELFPN